MARKAIHMISLATLSSIAEKHGLPPPYTMPAPWTGAASHVYPLDDHVIKIPFDRPDTIEAVKTDASIAPVVRALGVHVPELVVFDASRDILSVPFAVFRRIDHAVSIENIVSSRVPVREAWEEVGRQIARIHAVRRCEDMPLTLRVFRQTPDVDPRSWVDELRLAGMLEEDDARWLLTLLDRLAPYALEDIPLTLCHGDVNAANILVDKRSYRFRALIDWAGAGWLDPVWDFAAVSLDIVPFLLAGHRAVAPLPLDHTAEARICWCQAQTRLFAARQVVSPQSARDQLGRDIDQMRRFARLTGLF